MTHKSLALVLVPSLLLPATALATGTWTTSPPVSTTVRPISADVTALVREEIAGAKDRTVSELWQRARELRGAERLGAEGDLDRALDAELRQRELDPKAAILLCSSRLLGSEPDPNLLATALEPLIEAEDAPVARAAASLLSDSTFKALNRGRRSQLVTGLQKVAEDTELSPEHRLAFAGTAYRLGGGSDRRKAYALMNEFLNSSDAELRALGALAIAGSTEVDVNGELREVLEELAMVPNERGRLAAAYLEIEEEREYAESKLREARTRLGDGDVPSQYRQLSFVQQLISRMHLEGNKIEEEELMTAAIDGMLRWMDQHSSYLPPKTFDKFSQDLEAEYGGIGAYVNEDQDGLFTIVRPIYSGPAYEAGLQTDDKIVRIDDWPTLGHSEEDIIKRLKGKPGTPVDLFIWRRGMDPELIERPTDEIKVTIERGQIEIPAGSYQLLPGGIGLVELTTFNKRSQEQMKQWIRDMQKDGMRALILDMRRNSGGLLTEAREVADLFLPRDTEVVKTQDRFGPPRVESTRHGSLIPEDMPLVILTSNLTASAAEIVSGALQDHERATLVGRRTYGKGSVQQLIQVLPRELEDRWEDTNNNRRWDPGERLTVDHDGDGEMDYAPYVKLTIARYLLPSGRSIHRELDREGNIISLGGIQPDHQIEMPLIERWRFDERRKVQANTVLKDYLDRYYEENRELFHQLAVNDAKNPDLYPYFDELVISLETSLSRQDVRQVLRNEVRRRVQDDLGREFPWGDYVEDVQVQKGIEVLLGELGEDAVDISEFGLVFDLENAVVPEDLATLDPDGNRRLHRARQMLEQAKDGGAVLTEQSLDELIELLREYEAVDKN